jgi:uncharacterized protein YecE (DUF72 family)
MHYFVGTSGYSYKEWKGSFYPEKLPQKEMLRFYSQKFAAVEVNSSFRRMPEASVLKSWAQQVPEGFRFALKAPQAITHFKRLKNAKAETRELLRTASVLKGRQGPLLFQLPPNFKKDLPRLKTFLRLIGRRTPAAFEFRHESWFDDEVFDCLRENSCALCTADSEDSPWTDLVTTAGWGYVRLRRERYTAKRLQQWSENIRSQLWSETYVFFKHEDTGTGPKLAERFLKLAGR